MGGSATLSFIYSVKNEKVVSWGCVSGRRKLKRKKGRLNNGTSIGKRKD